MSCTSSYSAGLIASAVLVCMENIVFLGTEAINNPPKIDVCEPDSDQSTSSLCMSSVFLFNIDMVCHFTTVADSNTTEYDRGRACAVS